MWLVLLALRRPYNLVGLALLIALLGSVPIRKMSPDILPEGDSPVVSFANDARWEASGGAGLGTRDVRQRSPGAGELPACLRAAGDGHHPAQGRPSRRHRGRRGPRWPDADRDRARLRRRGRAP